MPIFGKHTLKYLQIHGHELCNLPSYDFKKCVCVCVWVQEHAGVSMCVSGKEHEHTGTCQWVKESAHLWTWAHVHMKLAQEGVSAHINEEMGYSVLTTDECG